MLAVSPIRSEVVAKDEIQLGSEDFTDFSDANLLETIDFDDLFLGIEEGAALPDLELVAELSANGRSEESDANTNSPISGSLQGDAETVLERDDEDNQFRKEEHQTGKPTTHDGDKGMKSSPRNFKIAPGKRKVKVDWTPELHRRFVQAVEQLGLDKAVPSRILEIMGIDCLTRHNIASHLQKYRSHRKHLLAREAETARWNNIRQAHGGASSGGGTKRSMTPWSAPTMGFPPATPMNHHFRPLHVWGHPPMDPSALNIWPKHLEYHPQPPPTAWAPHRPDLPYWNHQPVSLLPCYPQAIPPTTRFASPAIPGIPQLTIYADAGIGIPAVQTPQTPRAVFDVLPTKESIDAAIGDVISKPWLPLPLGLKPPSVDGVLVELQRQGIPEIPPCY